MDGRPRDESYDALLARAVGRTIKVLRADQAIERNELAERVGISYSYLTEIENGKKPASRQVLRLIAETLGMRLHELLAEAEDRVSQEDSRLESPPPRAKQMPPPGPPSPTAKSGAASYDAGPERLAYWGEERQMSMDSQSMIPPSVRRARAMKPPSPGTEDARMAARRSRLAAGTLEQELVDLMSLLSPDDQQRVLDLARRLAR